MKTQLIDFNIYTTQVPDKDGDYILTLKVNWQDPKHVASHMIDLEYKAKNGYTIRSGVGVVLDKTEKDIYLLGSMQHQTRTTAFRKTIPANIHHETFSSKEEMEKFKKDIIEAITDWVENGGFDTSHILEENFCL